MLFCMDNFLLSKNSTIHGSTMAMRDRTHSGRPRPANALDRKIRKRLYRGSGMNSRLKRNMADDDVGPI